MKRAIFVLLVACLPCSAKNKITFFTVKTNDPTILSLHRCDGNFRRAMFLRLPGTITPILSVKMACIGDVMNRRPTILSPARRKLGDLYIARHPIDLSIPLIPLG